MDKKFSTKFSDFKPQELEGKFVLFEHGLAYNSNYSYALTKITKVMKTGFRINYEPDVIFDFEGRQKGLSGRHNMAVHSQCYLITDQEYETIKSEWADSKKAKEMRETIKSKLDSLDLKCLEDILDVLNKYSLLP